jgi:hypothetical protein
MLRRPIFSILGAAKAATLDSDPPLIAAAPRALSSPSGLAQRDAGMVAWTF